MAVTRKISMSSPVSGKKSVLLQYLWKKRFLYILLLFPLSYVLIFCYGPMYGLIISFQNYIPGMSIFKSQWIGLKNFEILFQSDPFLYALRNTIVISVYRLLFGFPVPIIIALMLNEVKANAFKKTIQTLIYFPYFISWIIVSGILISFLSVSDGLVNTIIKSFGMEPVPFMYDPKYFRSVLVLSGIWKEAGWGTIIYLAALSSVDVQLYEAALIDGANRWQQLRYITLPCIAGTISVMFILAFSNIMNAGFDQVFVLLGSTVTDVGEIIDTFVYKVGMRNADYSLATAVGFFKGVVAMVLLTMMNYLSKKTRGEGIY